MVLRKKHFREDDLVLVPVRSEQFASTLGLLRV
jgi:hypothetical protein